MAMNIFKILFVGVVVVVMSNLHIITPINFAIGISNTTLALVFLNIVFFSLILNSI